MARLYWTSRLPNSAVLRGTGPTHPPTSSDRSHRPAAGLHHARVCQQDVVSTMSPDLTRRRRDAMGADSARPSHPPFHGGGSPVRRLYGLCSREEAAIPLPAASQSDNRSETRDRAGGPSRIAIRTPPTPCPARTREGRAAHGRGRTDPNESAPARPLASVSEVRGRAGHARAPPGGDHGRPGTVPSADPLAAPRHNGTRRTRQRRRRVL